MAKKAVGTYQEEFQAALADAQGDLSGRSLVDASLRALSEGFGSGEFRWAATPVILSEAQIEELSQAAATLGSIMEKTMYKYQRDRTFRPLFGLEPRIQDLTLVPTGRHAAVPLSRVDVIYSQQTGDFKICDIVTGGLDGMSKSVEVSRAVRQLAPVRRLADAHGGARTLDAVNECVLSILHTYGSWANAQEGRNHPTNPSLAVLDIADSPRQSETAYVVERFRDLGCYAHVTTFDKLRIEQVGGVRQLVDDHGPVTCVWLRATADEAVDMGEGLRALVEATRRGLVCTVGGYRSWPCCVRSFFELLRSKECRDLLNAEENAFVEQHIPQTTVIDSDTDLSDFYDQENWVLRDSDGNPLHMVAGASQRKLDWRNSLARSIRRHNAVQEAIPAQEMSVVVGMPADGTDPLEATKMSVLLGLYVFEGKLGGIRATCGVGNTLSDWNEPLDMGCLVVAE